MNQEKRQAILEMLAAGDITAEEAAGLLRRARSEPAPATPPPAPPEPEAPPAADVKAEAVKEAVIPVVEDEPVTTARPGQAPRWLRIRVQDGRTGRQKVRVNIPMRMLRLGLKLGGRFAPEIENMNWQELEGMFASAEQGVLVEVEDEESGENVKIYLD